MYKNFGLVHVNKNISGKNRKQTIFLDRDGVINQDSEHYIKNISEFKIFESSYLALKILNQQNFRVIVISNQSGIGRGIIKINDLEEIHNKLFKKVSENGGEIERVYFCPHTPSDNCYCRKPKPGMFFKVKEDYNLNFANIFYVGDRETDIIAGKNAGCKTVLLNQDKKKSISPDLKAKNLLKAVEIIVKNKI